MINLNHLAVFHAVAQAGSVSAGAERLMVSQPAVSKQLKQLERSLGERLFDRLPRGIRLTDVGTTLADHASRVFAAVENAEQSIDEVRGVRRGRLSVGATTSIAVYLLPEIFVEFRSLHPAIELNLEIGGSQAIAGLVLADKCNLAFAETAAPREGLNFRAFAEDELVAIVPVGHRLATRRSITCRELCLEPFVVRETGSETKSLVERTLWGHGLSVKPVMSLGSTEAIKRAVAAGLGVAIVSRMAIDLELRARTLATVRISDQKIRRPLYYVTASDRKASYAIEALTALIEKTVRRGRPKTTLSPAPDR
jgi:DNA-binding transcriptional LysR family regulator